MSRGLSEAVATAAGGKIFTFGSYRLGVHGPGSDLNTLCVVPNHVSRADFFEVFEPMLMEMEGVTEVSGVPDAYVPIVKAKISGIPLDFSMAVLHSRQYQTTYPSGTTLFYGIWTNDVYGVLVAPG
ncbi:hypothetical protein B0H13DRAFT_1051859 [Mycena leptocephala]|nr:hypothetical protein B0H13DRAFT_1051859 [Mycena leptocephala]